MQSILKTIDNEKARYLSELFDLLSKKSVSTDLSFKEDVADCADYLARHFEAIGMQRTEVIPTKKHPIVYSEYGRDPNKKTILIYGHYDVQPADPYELWDSDPFQAEIRDNKIFARGVSDDKGQFFCHIKAIEAWLSQTGDLPVNVKFLIEGEEEIGSPNLPAFIEANKEKLRADVAVISDTPMLKKGQPALCYSLRGLVYLELTVTGPNKDLHSGQYGGAIQNPIQALASIISALKDENDHVTIPGFYDDVAPLTDKEREALTKSPVDPEVLKKELDLKDLLVHPKKSVAEQQWLWPTLDCNGIYGGYTEEGAKTIIPSKASAKISMRLVANQNPHTVINAFKAHLESLCPKGVSVDLKVFNAAYPCKMETESDFMEAASLAFKESYNREPLLVGEGGSIPVVADFKTLLGIDTVMMGFNLPDDCIHSPNERMGVDEFMNGIVTSAWFYYYAGR